MDLETISKALEPFRDTELRELAGDDSVSSVEVKFSREQIRVMSEVADNLSMAAMMNHKTAQAAFPKLVKAVQLILAIEAHPFQNPTERVKLATKTRAQLLDALKIAGEAPAG